MCFSLSLSDGLLSCHSRESPYCGRFASFVRWVSAVWGFFGSRCVPSLTMNCRSGTERAALGLIWRSAGRSCCCLFGSSCCCCRSSGTGIACSWAGVTCRLVRWAFEWLTFIICHWLPVDYLSYFLGLREESPLSSVDYRHWHYRASWRLKSWVLSLYIPPNQIAITYYYLQPCLLLFSPFSHYLHYSMLLV